MKKKTIIIVAAILCVVAIGVSMVLIGSPDTDNDIDAFGNLGLDNGQYISRSEWIAQLSQCFALNTYNQTTPYYSDVPQDHVVFDFVQSCYEWGILRDKDFFKPEDTATRAFVAETAMLAATMERNESVVEMDASMLLQLANHEGILPQSTAYGVTAEECAQIIQNLKKYYLGYIPEEYANITLKENVVDYSSAEITWKDESVLVVPEDVAANLTVGTVFLAPGDSSATARKVVSVTSVNGQTEVETATPELEEVFDDLSFSFTGTPSLENIVPLQDGVTISPLEDVTPLSSSTSGAKIVKLSSATPLASGSKDDPISFGVEVNFTKGVLTPNIGFTDYFSLKAEQEHQKFFGKEIPDDAGELLQRTHTIFKYDKDGNLVLDKTEEWKSGYEIIGELKVSDLYVESVCECNDKGNLETFNCELHFTVESSLAYKGNLEGSVPVFETVIPGPYGIWVKVVFSVYVDLNGEIAVSAEIDHTTNVTYQNKKFKTVQDTDCDTNIDIGADIASGIKGEVILTVLGIDLVDVSAKAGVGLDVGATAHQSGNASMVCIEGECYFPTVSVSVGGNTETIAHKLGIELTLELVDKSGALLKSFSHTLWHCEITAAGTNNVKECTWDTYRDEVGNGNSQYPDPPQTDNSALIGRWVLYAGGTEIGNGLWMDRHIFTIELMDDGSASVSSGIMYSEYYSGHQGTWQAFAKSNNCFEVRFDMKGGNIIPGQETPQQQRSMTIEATIVDNTMRIKKLYGDDIDGVYAETYTKDSEITTPPTTQPPTTQPPATNPPATTPTTPSVGSTGLKFTFQGDSYSVSGIGTCTDTDIIIPDTYNGLPVTSIEDNAFSWCDSLTSVTIPDSVTKIGIDSLRWCQNLTYVIIGNGVSEFAEDAFSECPSLTRVVIGKSVNEIGENAFWECPNLTEFYVNSENANYASDINGALFSKDMTTIIKLPQGYSGEYIVPSCVTSIANSAFFDCDRLTSVTIPDSVTYIGSAAFYGCDSLTSVTIPDSVIILEYNSFYECKKLASVVIGKNVNRIGPGSFYGCVSLTGITIPDSVTWIGNYAFRHCQNLTNVVIGDGVTMISDDMFYGCKKLASVVIGKNVTTIRLAAFFECENLTSITLPGSVAFITGDAFFGCSSLSSIAYEGTVAEWNNISCGDFWFASVPATVIICSDGRVPIG